MITKFQKEQIFSLYYGYRVLIKNIKNDQYDAKIICKPSNWDGWESTALLELKPLSEISDEDATAIGKMLEYDKNEQLLVGRDVAFAFENNFVDKGCNVLEVADFLRSSGYAISAHGHSVDDLVKEGVFKLEYKK